MVTVFFDFDIIGVGGQVECVVGCRCELAVDIDLSGGGERVGREEAGAPDSEGLGGAVSLSIADHEESATGNEGKSGEENEQARGGGFNFDRFNKLGESHVDDIITN